MIAWERKANAEDATDAKVRYGIRGEPFASFAFALRSERNGMCRAVGPGVVKRMINSPRFSVPILPASREFLGHRGFERLMRGQSVSSPEVPKLPSYRASPQLTAGRDGYRLASK